jgi:hypothetical protein
MSVCSGIRADGGRCKAQAIRGSAYCVGHDPNQAEARQRRASKGGKRGGRGRPQADLTDLKRRISEVIDAVLEGSQDRGRAAVAIQGFNALRAVLEQERKIKETEDLEARIQALEDLQPAKSKGAHNRWR